MQASVRAPSFVQILDLNFSRLVIEGACLGIRCSSCVLSYYDSKHECIHLASYGWLFCSLVTCDVPECVPSHAIIHIDVQMVIDHIAIVWHMLLFLMDFVLTE